MWFFDKRLCEDVRIENDSQMHDLFEMYKDQMRCEVLVFDSCLRQSDEFTNLDPICVIPPEFSIHGNPSSKDIPPEDGNTISPDDNHAAQPSDNDEYPLEPEPNREPDMFDNDEEYVGVDDEGLYMPVQAANNAEPCNNHAHTANDDDDYVHVADQFDDVGAAEGGVPLEVEVNDADPEEVQVIYDPENPKIEKGERFPDIVAFRKAVRHHAVVKGFEFGKIITDKTRFITTCKAEGCPWRIHASRIFDGKTIEVN